jgi:thiol-disulfide isomerase/thioredoxin
MKYAIFIASLFAIAVFGSSCNSTSEPKGIAAGMWRMTLHLNDSLDLPFNFEWTYTDAKKPKMIILNAEERIEVDEIRMEGDSVFIRMPLFDSEFRLLTKNKNSEFSGVWIKHGKNGDISMPARGCAGRDYRFNEENATGTPANFEGKWQVTFSPKQGDKASPAIGLFKQEGKYITGTFATETGDYRYLEGAVINNKMLLSCFDGSHAYLFHGEMVNDKLQGTFYAGKSHQEPFEGVRNEQFELRSADALTYLNPGYKEVAFSFKNLEGKTVSLSDARYKNKPVIVQLMGSWCPNCMDEARLFSQLYKKYHGKGLEVIALAYEYSPDFEKAATAVRRHKQRLGCDYEFLITGVTPDKAAASLPMLNHVMSFPTSIFIDKKGTVRRIHTGFYGPGTGDYYTKFVAETESLLNQLVTE